jgi:hypothetical protein
MTAADAFRKVIQLCYFRGQRTRNSKSHGVISPQKERQPRSAFLFLPARGYRHLPLNLDAVRQRALTGDFGLIARVAVRPLQSRVQDC